MTEIRRFKTADELSVDEIAQRQSARNQGEPEPKFETPEYREAKVEALRDAGLDDEADEAQPGGKPLDEWTTEDHMNHMNHRRNR